MQPLLSLQSILKWQITMSQFQEDQTTTTMQMWNSFLILLNGFQCRWEASQLLNHELTLRNFLLNNELYLVKKIGQRSRNDNPVLAVKDKNIRKQSDSQYISAGDRRFPSPLHFPKLTSSSTTSLPSLTQLQDAMCWSFKLNILRTSGVLSGLWILWGSFLFSGEKKDLEVSACFVFLLTCQFTKTKSELCVMFFCRLYGLAGAMPPRTLNYQNFSTKMGLLSWVRMCISDQKCYLHIWI